jgi:tRNA (cmo5U34)-methyltransferase
MISNCNNKFKHLIDSKKVNFINQDIQSTEIKDASIVVINFVLQFIDSKKREGLLEKVYSGMKKNGLLILSEKTHFDNKFKNQTFFNLHHNFKFKNGYTKMEISRKRDALEGVLITDLEKDHCQRLHKIGYREIKKVMSNLNFFTLIAQK